MTRTLTQIQGEYGLNQDAEADPFKNLEESVLSNVDKMLQERESARQEMDAAKGFGRSTFHDAISAKQEGDVISQVGTQFAQARQQDALAQRQMERTITQAAVGHDLEVSKIEEQSRIQQEQYKTHEEIYADRGLTAQMKLFSEEKTQTIEALRARIDSGGDDSLTEEEFLSQSQAAIADISARQQEALKAQVAAGQISNHTAYTRQQGIIRTQYEEQAKLNLQESLNALRTAYGDDVAYIDQNGDLILNEDFAGDIAERAYQSALLDHQKYVMQMEAEILLGDIQFNQTLIKAIIEGSEFDITKPESWGKMMNNSVLATLLKGLEKNILRPLMGDASPVGSAEARKPTAPTRGFDEQGLPLE